MASSGLWTHPAFRQNERATSDVASSPVLPTERCRNEEIAADGDQAEPGVLL